MFGGPTVILILVACLLLAVAAAQVGTFTFLRKRALVGDVVAHAVLPGLCLSFIIAQQKHPVYLVGGAIITGWISLNMTDWLTRSTKLKSDTALGAVLSLFFGIGLVLLSWIQNGGNAAQAGLESYLFGKAASMTMNDAWSAIVVSVVVIAFIWVGLQQLTLLSFHPDYGKTRGYQVRLMELILSIASVAVIAVGIQAVGVVLIAALLIAPATAARFWSDRLRVILLTGSFIGLIAAFIAFYVSMSWNQMPTGPWMVLVLGFAVVVSALFSPNRGWIGSAFRQRQHERKMLIENILKEFYHLLNGQWQEAQEFGETQLQQRPSLGPKRLEKGLALLKQKKWVEERNGWWHLTKSGWEQAKRVVRLHRLWELYLTDKLRLPSDHVHQNAEAIEHVLTPEIEAALWKELGNPISDPHNQEIPR